MAEFVGGAALGAAFGELFALCRDAVRTTANFKPALKLLRNTLSDNQPVIDEIMKLDRCLGRVPENSNLSILLTRGQKLVVECSGVRPMNLIGRFRYSIKLKQLNDSLLRFFQIDEQAQISRDNREILLLVKQIRSSMNGGISRLRGIPGPPKHVVGFEKPLEEVKKKLLCDDDDDDTWPLVVVLSALGGQGKTTLAKMICHDNQITDIFEGNIFFVTFSEKPKIEVIVRKLIRAMGYPEPYEFATAEDAIHELEKSVRGIGAKHLLLVLDDVWSESEDFLEKFEFPVKGLKILVTSRSRFKKYEKNTYHLRALDEDDSLKLFRKLAYLNGKDHEMPDDLVSKVVKGCRGFPLALKVVASSLRHLPIEMWSEWSNHNSNDGLLDCLQRSVDVLDKLGDHIKDCYQDLALFPEDERIPVASLSDMWAELYNIDLGKTLVNLHELSLRNLVDLVSERRDNDIDRIELSSNEHYVTQHDVLRELAIRQSNRDPVHKRVRLNVDISSDSSFDLPTDQPLNARIVSFSTDDESHSPNRENDPRHRPRKSNSRVPRFMVWFVSIFLTMFQSFRSFFHQTFLYRFRANFRSLQLPETEALLLNIRSRTYSFPRFLNGMPQLKVLVVTNHGFHPSELHDFWVPSRLPSLRRLRLVHVSLSSFDVPAVDMKSLRKISLSMCTIGNAHRSLEKPVVDLPNLTEIEIDCCYEITKIPSELCSLVHVTKLRITNCQALIELPRELGKMRSLKELRLYSCTKLSKLPESIGDLRELEFLDVSECIGIEALPERIGELRGLRKLNVRGCTGLKRLPESIRNLHESLEVVCDEEVLCLWKNFGGEATNRNIKVVHRENSLNCLRL